MNSNVEKLVLLVTGTLEAGAIEIILSFLFFFNWVLGFLYGSSKFWIKTTSYPSALDVRLN
jgi:hypothetical protein